MKCAATCRTSTPRPLIGKPVTVLEHRGEMDQTLLGNLKAHGVARRPMQYGDAQFAQVVSTIRNEGGDTVGYVVEWRDRTQEALVEAEVARVIAQAAAGDLSAASTPATRKASSCSWPSRSTACWTPTPAASNRSPACSPRCRRVT
jgi:hypothetical protein